jgi:hypothetical protein
MVASATQNLSVMPGHRQDLRSTLQAERAAEGAVEKSREPKGIDHVKLPTLDEAESKHFADAPQDVAAVGGRQLTGGEKAMVERMRARDQEIRAHEQAHLAAAGSYAVGGAKFTYALGPDRKLYAVHGEVRIDPSPIPGDPHATLQKAEVVRRAALAPSAPSSADKAAAARADRMARAAREQIAKQQDAELKEQRGELEPGEAAILRNAAPSPSDGTSLLPSPGTAEQGIGVAVPGGDVPGSSSTEAAGFEVPGAAMAEAAGTYAWIASEAFAAGSGCSTCRESCACSRGYA